MYFQIQKLVFTSVPIPSHNFSLLISILSPSGSEGYKLAIQGMAHWMNHTCIKFKERENEEDYIKFVEIGGLVGLVMIAAC